MIQIIGDQFFACDERCAVSVNFDFDKPRNQGRNFENGKLLPRIVFAVKTERMELAFRERTEKLLTSIPLMQIVLMELWIFPQLIQIEFTLVIIPISKRRTVQTQRNIHGRECVEKTGLQEERII